MTIGIGATGPQAGLAVWRALAHVERVSTGSVGGFATFAVLTDAGSVERFGTQRGGSMTLFTEGESVLDRPPSEIQDAPIAGVISSGPDRPEPLSQFLAAADGVGLVTGHRLPNAPGDDGVPVNEQALNLLRTGHTAPEAVDRVVEQHPEIDAGLVAVDADGNVGAGNTEKVRNRPDVGHASRQCDGVYVEVLDNSIHPGQVATELAAEIAIDTMVGKDDPSLQIRVSSGLRVSGGDENRVVIDDDGDAVEVVTTDRTLLSGEQNGAVPYLGSTVVRDGTVIGELDSEANAVIRNGTIVSLSGQERVLLDVVRREADESYDSA